MPFSGLFVNNTIKLSDKFNFDKYFLDVTPADWTVLLTPLIYLAQGVWLTYGLILICRQTEEGPMYALYPVMPPIMYVVFSFSLACNVAWLLIWDKQYMEVALVFINLMTCTLYICLVVSVRRLNEFGGLMVRAKLERDIWIIRLFVQNGLAMYACWGSVAAVFNFAIVLTYQTGLTVKRQEVGSTVSLIIFTLEILCWFVLDNFVFERLLRYLISPYIVIITSLIGIITKNFDSTKRNSIYSAALLIMAIILTLIKITLAAWRHYKSPIFVTKSKKYRRPAISFEVSQLLDRPQCNA